MLGSNLTWIQFHSDDVSLHLLQTFETSISRILLAIDCAVINALALATTYLENRSTHNSNSIFDLSSRGRNDMWSTAIIWTGYVACIFPGGLPRIEVIPFTVLQSTHSPTYSPLQCKLNFICCKVLPIPWWPPSKLVELTLNILLQGFRYHESDHLRVILDDPDDRRHQNSNPFSSTS